MAKVDRIELQKQLDIITPVEYKNGLYFKRDDYYTVCGVKGGKSRSAYQIINNALNNNKNIFVTAGSRMSPQCEIVSTICEKLGLVCHLFMPQGKETSVIKNICQNKNSTIHFVKAGYNNVIISHAQKFAEENNYCYIPFGMECVENIEITKHQVQNIPDNVKRIVIPCGSGMSMISVIKGLNYYRMFDKKVLGVIVGKDPTKTFKRFLQHNLFEIISIDYSFVKSELDYHQTPKVTTINDVDLDIVYESKCIPFLKENDLLWIVGKRL